MVLILNFLVLMKKEMKLLIIKLKTMKKFLNWIFYLKNKVNSKPYRREIYDYFAIILEEKYILNFITEVKTYKEKGKIIIDIETHRPGLLIGKGGRTINGLKDYIERETKTQIKFKLRECTLWHKLY